MQQFEVNPAAPLNKYILLVLILIQPPPTYYSYYYRLKSMRGHSTLAALLLLALSLSSTHALSQVLQKKNNITTRITTARSLKLLQHSPLSLQYSCVFWAIPAITTHITTHITLYSQHSRHQRVREFFFFSLAASSSGVLSLSLGYSCVIALRVSPWETPDVQ